MLLTPGCWNSRPARVRPPDVDPDAAAHRVLEQYDQDGSGRLSEIELRACPVIHQHRLQYDGNGDGEIAQDEIAAYFRKLFGTNIGLLPVACFVRYNGRPLASAHVRFIPEECFAGVIQEAETTTDSDGIGNLSIASENLPDGLRNRRLMQVGLYRVEIEHSSLSPGSVERMGHEVNGGAADGKATFDL